MGSHYWSTAVTALNICVKDVPISCTNNRPAVCNYSSTMLQLKASMSYAYSPKLSDVSAIYDTTATETPTATSTTNVFLYVKLYTQCYLTSTFNTAAKITTGKRDNIKSAVL